MPDLLQLSDAAANLQLQRYYDQIQALTDRALNGDIYENEFGREYERLALAALLLAFLLAGGDQSNPAAARELEIAQRQARESAGKLASDIYDGRYSASDETGQTAEQGREKLDSRLALWTFSLGELYHVGMLYNRSGRNKRWGLGFTEKHCDTCLRLDGVVLTPDEWSFLGIRPQSSKLACRGFHCDCDWTETDEPSIGLENVMI